MSHLEAHPVLIRMPWRSNKLQPFQLQGSQSDNNSIAESVGSVDWEHVHGPYDEGQNCCSDVGSPNLELDDDLEEGSNATCAAEGPKRVEALNKLGAKSVAKGPVAGDSR